MNKFIYLSLIVMLFASCSTLQNTQVACPDFKSTTSNHASKKTLKQQTRHQKSRTKQVTTLTSTKKNTPINKIKKIEIAQLPSIAIAANLSNKEVKFFEESSTFQHNIIGVKTKPTINIVAETSLNTKHKFQKPIPIRKVAHKITQTFKKIQHKVEQKNNEIRQEIRNYDNKQLKRNQGASWALGFGIAGLFIGGIIFGALAIWLGQRSLKK